MNKFSNKEAIATYLGWSFDDVEDARYHYGMTKSPVYSVGNTYIICLANGKKVSKHDNDYVSNEQGKFVEATGGQADYCKQRGKTIWIYESK